MVADVVRIEAFSWHRKPWRDWAANGVLSCLADKVGDDAMECHVVKVAGFSKVDETANGLGSIVFKQFDDDLAFVQDF